MNTVSNERLEKLSSGNAWTCVQDDEAKAIATELLALRKEREKAEPVVKAAEKLVRCKGRYHSEQNYRALAALFGVTTPDLPPLEGEALRELAEPDYIRYDCGCCGWETIEDWRDNDVCPKCNHKPLGKTGLYTAPPAPSIADDSLPYDPQIAEYEQMMEAEQAQADTASQQFESLAGKAVSGWIPCGERMPEDGTDADGNAIGYLVLYEAGKEPNGGFNVGVWNVTYLRSWWRGYVTHWMPLPAAPEPCK
ncbi:DUF551 domain-containing protein [Cronobacter sakazakii]|nr:DUF551 domain-containing protein [Cronobacter sakazakii]